MFLDYRPGPLVQSVTRLTADPGAASSIPAWSQTFLEIDHELIFTVILLQLIQEGLLSVTSVSVHKVLVNHLVKLAQEKVWLGELTVST